MALYIIPNAYEPQTAATNRIEALLRNMDNLAELEEGQVSVVFIEPDLGEHKIGLNLTKIKIVYLWKDGDRNKNRIIRRIKTLYREYRFCCNLKKGDSILLAGYPQLIRLFLKKKGIKVYHEMSEHPEVIPLGPKGQQVSVHHYLKQCRHLNGLFVISSQLADYFAENGVSKEKIHLYKMTVEPLRFEGLKKQEVETQYIAYCGTASNFKDGVDILLEAFSLVKKKYNSPLKLYIIGRTPSKTDREGNLRLIDDLGIAEDVYFTGIVRAQDMPQMLKNAEALALARPDNIQAKHGFPTKLGEYLLTGNPVVITAVGDIPRYLKDGESALIATPSDANAFAQKILWVLNNKEESLKIGEKGREVALREFNPQIEAKHILNVINKPDQYVFK